MRCRSDALLVLLGVGIGSTALIGTSSTSTTTNGVSDPSGLGLGVSVVEAFSPSYKGICGHTMNVNCRSVSLSSALYAEDASSSSADAANDATDDGEGGGISMEAGGQLTKKSDQPPSSADSNSAQMSEYRPLQRQWWEVRSSPTYMLMLVFLLYHACTKYLSCPVIRHIHTEEML